MSTTTKRTRGYRPHPAGPGYQVRIHPFPAETVPTEDEAITRAAQLREYRRAGIRNLAQVEASARLTLAEACDGYEDERISRGGRYGPMTAKTRNAIARRLDRFRNGEHGDTPVAWLKRRDIAGVVNALAAEYPAEAQDTKADLYGALRWAQNEGEPVPANLFTLAAIPVRARQRKALNGAEVEYLAARAVDYGADALRFLASAGGRQGETFAMEPSWLNLKARTLTVPAEACKERREKVIVLTPTEVQILRRQLIRRAPGTKYVFPRKGGGRWSVSGFHRLVWEPARRAAANDWREEHGEGVTPFDGLRAHDLRSTAATRMRDEGVPVEIAAARLGHKDGGRLLVTTYRKVSTDAQRAALDAAGYGHAGGGAEDGRNANPDRATAPARVAMDGIG